MVVVAVFSPAFVKVNVARMLYLVHDRCFLWVLSILDRRKILEVHVEHGSMESNGAGFDVEGAVVGHTAVVGQTSLVDEPAFLLVGP